MSKPQKKAEGEAPKPKSDVDAAMLGAIESEISVPPEGAEPNDEGDQDPKGQPAKSEEGDEEDGDEAEGAEGGSDDGEEDHEPKGDGQPAKSEKPEGPTEEEKARARAITEANKKTQQELETVVGLLKGNKEKLDALKASNPKLFDKLISRVPDLYGPEARKEEDKDKFHVLLETVLTQQEESDYDEFRDASGIAEADFAQRREKLKETARILYDEGLVKDWKRAIRDAGKIVFPHLVSTPVDTDKLKKIKGQKVSVSGGAPSPSSEMDDDDKAIMSREGVTKEQYSKMVKGDEIFAPGILG